MQQKHDTLMWPSPVPIYFHILARTLKLIEKDWKKIGYNSNKDALIFWEHDTASSILIKKRKENKVKPVYKGHSREPVNVPLMSSCAMLYSLMEIMRLSFIDSDLSYRGAL